MSSKSVMSQERQRRVSALIHELDSALGGEHPFIVIIGASIKGDDTGASCATNLGREEMFALLAQASRGFSVEQEPVEKPS